MALEEPVLNLDLTTLPDTEQHIVSMLLINVEAAECASILKEVESLMNHKGSLPGFVEGEIFRSADETRILIITEWSSQHDWSMSQWDGDVSNNLVSIVQTAGAIDSRTYYRAGRISKAEVDE